MKYAAAMPIPTTANLAGTCWPGPSILMTTPLMMAINEPSDPPGTSGVFSLAIVM